MDGTISNSYASGTVSGNYGCRRFGWEYNDGTISNSYASGQLVEVLEIYVGGLVGYNDIGTISNSYASGNVMEMFSVGGLVGFNDFGTISNSYATGNVTETIYVGGLVGGYLMEQFQTLVYDKRNK